MLIHRHVHHSSLSCLAMHAPNDHPAPGVGLRARSTGMWLAHIECFFSPRRAHNLHARAMLGREQPTHHHEVWRQQVVPPLPRRARS